MYVDDFLQMEAFAPIDHHHGEHREPRQKRTHEEEHSEQIAQPVRCKRHDEVEPQDREHVCVEDAQQRC